MSKKRWSLLKTLARWLNFSDDKEPKKITHDPNAKGKGQKK